MSSLKETLRADLTESMRARDELRTATIRMALAAISTEEVAGRSARELDDADVLRVLNREAKKRRESARAYDQANRLELASRERAELAVLAHYLPTPLTEQQVDDIVGQAIADSGATSMRDMGDVMKLVTPQTTGRADGKQVSDRVRRALQVGQSS